MKVISISSQKGGAGKTVVTALVANSLAIDFQKKVLVIDADPQSSMSDIRARDLEELEMSKDEMPYQIEKMPATRVVDYLEKLQEDSFDVILIDLPGRMDDTNLIRIIQELDCILIPLVAEQTDFFATIDFIEMLTTVLTKLEEIGVDGKKVYAFNNKSNGSIEEKGLEEYCNNLNLLLLNSKISSRKIYSRFTTYTSYMSEPGYKYNGVREEMKAFMDEVVEKLEL
jgi:chromosome partitioning protein